MASRVISLLNCLGKVSGRILAKRLVCLAETTELLHPSQICGRLKKSAIDTALLLTNEVEINKQLNKITSSLFLDVKGAFDHVARNQFVRIPLSICKDSLFHSYLVFVFSLLPSGFDNTIALGTGYSIVRIRLMS